MAESPLIRFYRELKRRKVIRVAVAYAIQKERYDPYEIVVFGKQRRRDAQRLVLLANADQLHPVGRYKP